MKNKFSKKKESYHRVMTAQLEKAKNKIEAHASDFESARQTGQNFPTMEEFIAGISNGLGYSTAKFTWR